MAIANWKTTDVASIRRMIASVVPVRPVDARIGLAPAPCGSGSAEDGGALRDEAIDVAKEYSEYRRRIVGPEAGGDFNDRSIANELGD